MATHETLLSSVDQLMPKCYIRLFLVVKTCSSEAEEIIACLQRGLGRTQQQLPYIGGEIFESGSGRIGVRWTQNDPLLRIQKIQLPPNFPSATQLRQSEHPFGDVWRIEKPNDRFGEVKVREGMPVITITCSELDGYLILGISCFHSIWDIAGLSYFLYLWSRNTKKPHLNADLPILEDISMREARLRLSLKQASLDQRSNFRQNLETFEAHNEADLDHCVLSLDIAKLTKLRQELSAASQTKVSINDLVVAIIWTSIASFRCSQKGHNLSLPRLRTLVDGRRHVFQSHTHKTVYLGNLALPLFSTFADGQTIGDRAASGFKELLSQATNAIHLTLQQASSSAFSEAIETLDKADDVSLFRETSAVYNSKQLTSTSWSQAPMYIDFGPEVGRVEYVRIAPLDYKLEGMILTLPRKKSSKGAPGFIEVFVTLRKDELKALKESEMIQSLTYRTGHGSVESAQSKL